MSITKAELVERLAINKSVRNGYDLDKFKGKIGEFTIMAVAEKITTTIKSELEG